MSHRRCRLSSSAIAKSFSLSRWRRHFGNFKYLIWSFFFIFHRNFQHFFQYPFPTGEILIFSPQKNLLCPALGIFIPKSSSTEPSSPLSTTQRETAAREKKNKSSKKQHGITPFVSLPYFMFFVILVTTQSKDKSVKITRSSPR